MPAHKRSSSEKSHDDEESQQLHYRRKQSRHEQQRQAQEQQLQVHEEQQEQEDSDGSGTDPEELSEFISVRLLDDINARSDFTQLFGLHKDVRCAICLGIIKKTRTVMECMHRFCRDCIDKSMRLGNNECPACRTHCASRRSLRDDPKFDALIESLIPDVEKYEEEELAFHEDERTRNEEIQASIAQIFRRQSEALVRRRTMGKDIAAAAATERFPLNSVNAYSRRRRNSRGTGIHVSNNNEDENDHNGNKDSSSTDERGAEIKQRRCQRRTGVLSTQPSPSAANSDGGCVGNGIEASRENRGSPGHLWNPEILAWGRGGTRSHTRHGSAISSKGARSSRLSKLVDYLQSLKENDDELDVYLLLISLDKQRTPSMQQSYLCCRPSLSVKHLCECVAHETSLRAEDVEMLLVKETPNTNAKQCTINSSTSMDDLHSLSQEVGRCKVKLHRLEEQETLAALKANCTSSDGHLILGYRQKETS